MIFERNSERMRYARYRAEKLFVGSGVVEAGCKTAIGRRLKMSGMFWTVRGANSLIALRCNRISGNSPTIGSPVPHEFYNHVAHSQRRHASTCLINVLVEVLFREVKPLDQKWFPKTPPRFVIAINHN